MVRTPSQSQFLEDVEGKVLSVVTIPEDVEGPTKDNLLSSFRQENFEEEMYSAYLQQVPRHMHGSIERYRTPATRSLLVSPPPPSPPCLISAGVI
jgi:hypothetical protein